MKTLKLTRERPETCLSDLRLDRLLRSELEGSEQAQAKAHLEGCALCKARRDSLEEAQEAFNSALWTARALKAQRQGQTPRRPRWLRAAFGLGAVAAAVLFALVLKPKPEGPDTLRTKGALSLSLIAKRKDGHTERLGPGAQLKPLEALRFELSSQRGGYLLLGSVDASSKATLYYPHEAKRLKIEAGSVLLDGSITLDHTLGPERILALLCEQPVPGERFLKALEEALLQASGDPQSVSLQPEALSVDCQMTSFTFEKTVH